LEVGFRFEGVAWAMIVSAFLVQMKGWARSFQPSI